MNKIICMIFIFAIFLSSCNKKGNIDYNNEVTIIDEIIPEKIVLTEDAKSRTNEDALEDTLLEISRTMYVYVEEGLRVRNSPSLEGDRIALLDFNTEVAAKKEVKKSVIIDGISGRWTFIESGDIQGWVFGGYLSLSDPTFRMMDGTIGIIAEYIAYDFGLWSGLWEEKNRDRNDLRNFLASYNILDYKIIKRDTSRSRHDENIILYYYTIESGPYTLYVLGFAENPRLGLLRIEIEIDENNYRYLFPYNTMDEYLRDVNFGSKYGDSGYRILDESDIIYYSDRYENSWYLKFKNGILDKIGFAIFSP